MPRLVAGRLFLMLALASAASSGAAAQGRPAGPGGPRFLLGARTVGPQVDASRVPVLQRRVSLASSIVTIGEALREVTRQAELEIAYSPRVVPLERRVSLQARPITVGAALTAILVDVPVDVSVTTSGSLALVPRSPATSASIEPDSGTVSGQVRDSATEAPVVGATVSVDGTSHTAVTDVNGRYRIRALAPGTYVVRARYIGYLPLAAAVTVIESQETIVDLSLVRSARHLEEVVTTGTVIPTEVKALPTPVSVIEEADVAAQRPPTVMALFRQAVPTAVSWDDASVPHYAAFSVRGASTLAGQVGQMKVFVDGVEAASLSLTTVDPNSIARVEVVRGPQAAAIYGSDAIGGVIQIFTKRGDPALIRPQVEAGASVGVLQTPYDGFNGVLRQSYSASMRGGSELSYNFGGGYTRTADYLPAGEVSEQSNPSVYGGMHLDRGIITADVSGRYYTHNVPIVANPALAGTGDVFYSKPFFEPQQYQNQTVGTRLGVAPTRWWRHAVAAGVDRVSQDQTQTKPRLTTPDDTLLSVFNQNRSKTSIGYNTSVFGPLSRSISGSITLGFDHYSLSFTRFSTFGALNTAGTIQTAAGSSIDALRAVTTNTGYFAQAQVSLEDAFFLTGGVRAEQNSNFGDSLGTPISPRVGISYVRTMGPGAIKVRGSWGRALRAPDPGLKLASVSTSSVQLANPLLGPERQHGWDAGIDATMGSRASLSVTFYHQIATDLIQSVELESTPVRLFQVQNVGRVKNTGVEVEGMMQAGPIQLKAQYGYARARIEKLGANYTGDLRPGDQALTTPRHTAGAFASATPVDGMTVTAGMTYVGSWHDYDWVGMFSCFAGTGPCPSDLSTLRGFITEYPGFAKINIGVTQQLTGFLSGFIGVDNLTNNEAYEASNFSPTVGRITTIGLRARY